MVWQYSGRRPPPVANTIFLATATTYNKCSKISRDVWQRKLLPEQGCIGSTKKVELWMGEGAENESLIGKVLTPSCFG